MSGSKILLLFLLICGLTFAAPQKVRKPRKPAMSRYFLATSLGNWQHEVMITDGTDSLFLMALL